jgi:hypothetical protein
MEHGRANWNDDRLDRFADQIDKRFEQVDKRFEQVDKRFDKLESRIEAQGAHFDARFDALQQAMVITLGSILVAFVGLFATVNF